MSEGGIVDETHAEAAKVDIVEIAPTDDTVVPEPRNKYEMKSRNSGE
jgi:hypothetical protein